MSPQKLFRLVAVLSVIALPAQAADFSNWAAVVVAADNRAGDGQPSEVFDNARRDLASDFAKMGFASENILQFSVQPEKFPDEKLQLSDPQRIGDQLYELLHRTPIAGCLVYLTSHGSPQGIWVRTGVMPPAVFSRILKDTCGDKPTVAVVSACYSGVFVLDLMADNHFVFTAARRDRTSFGCGATDEFTFFDACFLQSLPAAGNFDKLALDTKTCVAASEQKVGVAPSEPQLVVGYGLSSRLPTWTPFVVDPKPKKPAPKKP